MKDYKMSLFLAPISPVRDADTEKIITPATLKPFKTQTLQEVYRTITTNRRLKQLTEQVRQAAESGNPQTYRTLKQELLPYVTPCGIFSYRRGNCLVQPSGLFVVDIDHLDSTEEAEELRGKLSHDSFLNPALVFISPCGKGVKAFVPYDLSRIPDLHRNAAESIYWAMDYVQCVYADGNLKSDKGVDTSGKDLVRACFLSYDPHAIINDDVSPLPV